VSDAPVFRAVGAEALLIVFGETVSEAVNRRVMTMDASLARAPPRGFVEAAPAYASLLVVFDPLVTDHAHIEAHMRALRPEPSDAVQPAEHSVPVCYDPEVAPDLEAVSAALGLTRDEAIARHLAAHYRVYMYGFAPGYAYLGGVPEGLHLPRKPQIVRHVPAGSVIIAGAQCLITTLTMPTGWWIIGRSAVRVLDPHAPRPFRFAPGDRVRFTRTDRAGLAAAQ
jgi:inhibitor of KinA